MRSVVPTTDYQILVALNGKEKPLERRGSTRERESNKYIDSNQTLPRKPIRNGTNRR